LVNLGVFGKIDEFQPTTGVCMNSQIFRVNALSAAIAAAGLVTFIGPAFGQQSNELQEITVTAQKRVQASTKVPVALSVVDGEDIKSNGISTLANLTDLVPNVQMGMGNNNGMEITIRGIGGSDNSDRGDPQTAFHVDGIYIGRPQGAGATFFDVERVEVLRGPQGTLYGRNANAGAVNVISKKPTNKFEGAISTEAGSWGSTKVEGMMNVPMSEDFALRAVVSQQKHDGYADTANATTRFGRDRDDQNNLSGRVQGLLRISPATSLRVGLDSSSDKGTTSAFYDITNGSPTTRVLNTQVQGRMNNKNNGVVSELKHSLGDVDLVYLYGHRGSSRDEESSYGAAPSTYAPYTDTYKQDSHELRFSSSDAGPLQWVVGAYTFEEVGRHIDLDVMLPAAFGGGRAIHFVQDPAISKSTAIFGQTTYSLTPALRATLGLRTTTDEKSRDGQTRVGPNDTPIGVVGNKAAGKWTSSTYRAGVEYDLNANQMAYANISTGFKAGGFNDGNSVVGDPNYNSSLYYKPESITSYEAGVKGRYLENKVQLGASVFYYDYTDLQKSAAVNNQLVTVNAGQASVKGVEFEGRAKVSNAGRINFAVGLLSAQYKKYVSPSGQDLSGQDMDRAPKTTVTLGYTHNWSISSGARLTAYAGKRYSSSYVLSDTGTATQAPRFFTQSSFSRSDLTMTYGSADEHWSLQAFVKNIENKGQIVSLFSNLGSNYASLSEPRTMGIRASYKY
jgi:iron complex outermembrane receptor protein